MSPTPAALLTASPPHAALHRLTTPDGHTCLFWAVDSAPAYTCLHAHVVWARGYTIASRKAGAEAMSSALDTSPRPTASEPLGHPQPTTGSAERSEALIFARRDAR